ncbi:MAG: hypothetical protein NWE98_01655 [Candidatus Bathyarchaeota archaeon]|nr:hypothetical protein [Candidatus Bathyarchaeota archaeon]
MRTKKAIIYTTIAVLLACSLSLSLAAALPQPESVANRPISRTWIRINGYIEKWGTTDVRGLLQTQARTALLASEDTRQLSGASAIWTTNITRAIQAAREKANFTYVYYGARLLNNSVLSLTASSADSPYEITGQWNVATVKANITILTNENGEIIRVLRHQDVSVQKVQGTLSINSRTFTLTFEGMEPLTGTVFRSVTRTWFNPFKITDDATTSAVTKADIREIAKCYGSMPGWGSYDTRMDFNNNFRVDIADISTVAANT